jgi:hypothetical protein
MLVTAIRIASNRDPGLGSRVAMKQRIPSLLAVLAGFHLASAAVDFYDRSVAVLNLFGQEKWQDAMPGRVDGAKIHHASGILVDDRAGATRIYVADSGNNRILAFAAPTDASAAFAIGQPDLFSGAANGDSNIGFFGPAGADTLCLTGYPQGTNIAEQWLRLNFDVDAEGNLYVPDTYNNRVLMYRDPFSSDKSGGKGDTVADQVWGQDDFSANQPNRGMGTGGRDARSLYISYGGWDHVSARGVSVDPSGNLWVADTFNSRVLRFPPGQSEADLVLGQPDFSSNVVTHEIVAMGIDAPFNRMVAPTIARVDPDSGELYVIDEYPGGFPARLLVFTPPFSDGMAASRRILPRQQLAGDFSGGYRWTHATGLVFNPYKSTEWIDPDTQEHPYSDGLLWVHDGYKRVLLLDSDGEILLAIGAPDLTSFGCQWQYYGDCGRDPATPFNLGWPGGMIGFDSANNIYLADEHWHRVARFALPYRPDTSGTPVCLPLDNGGLFAGTYPNSTAPGRFHQDRLGVIAAGGQLIVRDYNRYMVWDDYMEKPIGAEADHFVGQPDGYSDANTNLIHARSMHAIDHANRLWCRCEHDKLMVYQLPLDGDSEPLAELLPLYWADDPSTAIDYHCGQALAFDPVLGHLWVVDISHHRLLRITNPDDYATKLLVDVVIGQSNKTDGQSNRGMPQPVASSIADAGDIKFDGNGNLYVVDNVYECHPNARIITFLAEDLAAIDTLFPSIEAKRVFVTPDFTTTAICRIHDKRMFPHSPVSIAFNAANDMVVGNDGYYRDHRVRLTNQLYYYTDPLNDPDPDYVIALPLGAPGELCFDEQDNLIVQDHTWNRVWVINLTEDPSWLVPLAPQADSDRDGLPNRIEFAFGTDPAVNDSAGRFPVSGMIETGGQRHLRISFTRLINLPADVSLSVEISDDMENWSVAPAGVVVTDQEIWQGDVMVVTLRLTDAIQPGSPRFMRLVANAP